MVRVQSAQLAKDIVAPSCQSSIGWVAERIIKWSIGARHLDIQKLCANVTFFYSCTNQL